MGRSYWVIHTLGRSYRLVHRDSARDDGGRAATPEETERAWFFLSQALERAGRDELQPILALYTALTGERVLLTGHTSDLPSMRRVAKEIRAGIASGLLRFERIERTASAAIASEPSEPPSPRFDRRPAVPIREAFYPDEAAAADEAAAESESEPESVPPPGPEPELTWIKVTILDLAGRSLSGQAYELELPDGSKRSGTLDDSGTLLIEDIPAAGDCQLILPNCGETEWQAGFYDATI